MTPKQYEEMRKWKRLKYLMMKTRMVVLVQRESSLQLFRMDSKGLKLGIKLKQSAISVQRSLEERQKMKPNIFMIISRYAHSVRVSFYKTFSQSSLRFGS
jgi:hypothetical protein